MNFVPSKKDFDKKIAAKMIPISIAKKLRLYSARIFQIENGVSFVQQISKFQKKKAVTKLKILRTKEKIVFGRVFDI